MWLVRWTGCRCPVADLETKAGRPFWGGGEGGQIGGSRWKWRGSCAVGPEPRVLRPGRWQVGRPWDSSVVEQQPDEGGLGGSTGDV